MQKCIVQKNLMQKNTVSGPAVGGKTAVINDWKIYMVMDGRSTATLTSHQDKIIQLGHKKEEKVKGERVRGHHRTI